MRIFIIGPMASGKSTIGQKLAKSLSLDFIDTDKEIERLAGVNISWIFDIEGEDNFRLREEKVLQEVSKKGDCVISTGGGIVLSKKNRELLNASGLIIYLKVAIQTQLERTLLDKSRPLLKVDNKESLKGAIDLGIAMQLTNIARDVIEDKDRNREYISNNFSSIREVIRNAEIFYEKSFCAISSIPIKSRFSVIVARRVYKKIGDYILKQENIENYNKAGKIYVPMSAKIIETILSIVDFLKLLFVKNISYYNHDNHTILNQEINLNERI